MKRPSIGVATCASAPDLDEDGGMLLAALADAGAEARPAVWDDVAVDWPAFDTVLVRSTWDYPLRRDEFLAWARRCARTANPRPVLEWNTDKRYLADLAAAGVPSVPTTFVLPGSAMTAPHGGYVVKPTVSGSAADTGRFDDSADPAAHELVARIHAQGRTVMQPTSAQRAVAEAALAGVPGGAAALSYARVDLIPGPDGPVVLELEATDCYLFLGFAESEAVKRFAEHVVARAEGPAQNGTD
jgi:hypothetical protein